MRIAKATIVVACLMLASVSNAQYFQYSQYNFTEQRINPAMVGMSRYASASADFRNQKNGGEFPINSSYLELGYPLLNSSTGQPWSGIGISLHDDRAGGIYKTQEAALSYAMHLRVGRFQTFSFGAKLLHKVMQVSLDGFYTGAQYVPDRGFNLAAESGENFATYRRSVNTFSTGFYWQETDRNGRPLHYLGISLFDINRPPDSFIGNNSALSSTVVLNGSFQAYSTADFHIFPEALFTYSASTSMLNVGVRFQKELNQKLTQLSDRVELLTKYAVGRSGIVGLQLHKENFSVGLSYDFPFFHTNAGNLGALEVGLTVRKLVLTPVQKQTVRRKKAVEERKKLVAQRSAIKANKSRTAVAVKEDTAIDSTSHTIPLVVPTDSTFNQRPVESTTSTAIEVGKIKQDPLVVEKVTLNFGFEFNSIDLDDTSEDFIRELYPTLSENESLKISVTGFTDNIGSEKFNLRLSQKRAHAVRNYLLKLGVAPERITSEGMGMQTPLNDNQTDADRAKNRRVEIIVHY
ncbi:hypothetical protein BH10BAC4_BH10BAC4_24240 [soil metagenome]